MIQRSRPRRKRAGLVPEARSGAGAAEAAAAAAEAGHHQPQQHQWRRSQDAERRMEQSTQPPPPPASTSPKSEPPDKLQGESQSDYMKRLAQLRAAKRRAEEQAEDDARRARARRGTISAPGRPARAAHPPARPPPVQQQPEEDRWQRGARVPAPPVEREPLRDAGVPIERAATRDGRSFASMFSPPSEPNPDQLKVGDGYDRHPNREKPKLFDPKVGVMWIRRRDRRRRRRRAEEVCGSSTTPRLRRRRRRRCACWRDLRTPSLLPVLLS